MQASCQTAFRIPPSIRQASVQVVNQRIKEMHVTKEYFSNLKVIIRELGNSVSELAEAHKHTKMRVEGTLKP